MSRSPLPSLYLSAFPREYWVAQHPITLSLDKRIVGTLVDLYRQIIPFAGAYVVTSFFLNPQDRVRFAFLGLGCVAGNLGCRTLSHLFQYYHQPTYQRQAAFLKTMEHIAYTASQLFLATFYVMTISRVVHELGRAITTLMLFQSPTPVIKIGFLTSHTEFIPGNLTPLGEKIGWAYSIAIMKVAGSLSVLFHELFLVQYAHDNKDNDPMLSTQAYLRVLLSSLRVLPPLLPLLKKLENHGLEKNLGFHPIAEAVCFLAAPILYEASLFISDGIYRKFGTMHLKPDNK